MSGALIGHARLATILLLLQIAVQAFVPGRCSRGWSPRIIGSDFMVSEIRQSCLLAKIESIDEGDDGGMDEVALARAEAAKAAKALLEGPSDEEQGKTHGYEGTFKVGQTVRIKTATKIWSVKPYTKEGFDPKDLVGTVSQLVLYGRKYKSLCSAITPVKVEFAPTHPSLAAKGLNFERKFTVHFAADELELISS